MLRMPPKVSPGPSRGMCTMRATAAMAGPFRPPPHDPRRMQSNEVCLSGRHASRPEDRVHNPVDRLHLLPEHRVGCRDALTVIGSRRGRCTS
jgi:hypothetical protein